MAVGKGLKLQPLGLTKTACVLHRVMWKRPAAPPSPSLSHQSQSCFQGRGGGSTAKGQGSLEAGGVGVSKDAGNFCVIKEEMKNCKTDRRAVVPSQGKGDLQRVLSRF